MKIRLAAQEDLVAINKIYNQAVNQRFCTAHLSPVSMEYREKWFLQHVPDRYPVYVAEVDKQLYGWVSLGTYRSDRQALAHVGEVSYFVDENRRGEGVGSKLLEHAIAVAPRCGLTVLIAILLDKNPASIALGAMPGIAIIGDEMADHLYYGLKL